MHVIVTGASGFIGRQLRATLLERGHTVSSVSRSAGIDVTSWKDVESIDGPADLIFHLAALTGGHGEAREIYAVNWLGTLHLLEYMRLHKVSRLVFASSYVYGQPQYLPVDEDHPSLGKGAYARSKVYAEELCRCYATDYDLSIVALRVFNPYGPGQHGNMLIPTILSQLTTVGEVVLRDPAPRRDYVYVEDVVEALRVAAQDPNPGFRVYNVASGESYSVEEIVREIGNAWGHPFPVLYTGEQRPNEIMDCSGSNLLIAKRLGWKPKVSLREGIRRTVAWWR